MMHVPKNIKPEPILMNMLSTTLRWLINERELNEAINGHLERIEHLNNMSDTELAAIGITRDQITAFVLQEGQ